MTQIAAQAQIKAIEKAKEKSTKSKESALQFLREAGIIKSNADADTEKPNSTTKKR